MTTTLTPTTTPTTSNGRTALRVTQVRVLFSEWTKFRSLRSTVSTLLIAVVLKPPVSSRAPPPSPPH